MNNLIILTNSKINCPGCVKLKENIRINGVSKHDKHGIFEITYQEIDVSSELGNHYVKKYKIVHVPTLIFHYRGNTRHILQGSITINQIKNKMLDGVE